MLDCWRPGGKVPRAVRTLSRMEKMNRSHKLPKTGKLPQISMGLTVKEALPFPIVHYPSHYGTFIAFSKEINSNAYLCSCTRPAVENFYKLKFRDNYRKELMEFGEFPSSIRKTLENISPADEEFNSIFVPNICHRCNMKTPTVRWCHEMYGVTFVQFFGWYIKQNYYRIGILPGETSCEFLDDICPEPIQKMIVDACNVDKKLRKFEEMIRESFDKESKTNSVVNQKTLNCDNLNNQEPRYVELSRQSRILRRKIDSEIENITRTEFGFKKIGEGWVSETLLFNIIRSIFPNKEIIRHHRPDWLERLELDIFIPDIKIAFEYQGQQHFFAVDAWGGKKALLDLQERDNRKIVLCKENDIKLYIIDFSEPLTENYIRQVISK